MKRYEVMMAPSGHIGLIIPAVDDTAEYTVEIPLSIDGLRLFKTILVAGHYKPKATIGEPAKPVAGDIAKFLAERTPKPPEPIIQRPLDPDLEDIELDI